jgi:hypothetical protein
MSKFPSFSSKEMIRLLEKGGAVFVRQGPTDHAIYARIVEECLKILLRGKQSIIICPARAMEGMRIPTECRPAFESGRILFLSPFFEKPNRIDRQSAQYRNEMVAALADSAFLAYIRPGGEMERMASLLDQWGVTIL